MMSEGYLRFDEQEDFICSLEHGALTAALVAIKPSEWKWLIISIHSAWQAAMVCTLSGSDGIGALATKQQRKMMKWFEDSRGDPNAKQPDERMADPMELLKRCRGQKYMSAFGGQRITLSLEQYADARRLNVLRRDFAHFTPKGWSIEKAGLPRMVQNTLAIIAQLIEHPANRCRLDDNQNRRITAAATAIETAVSHQ